MEYQVKIEGLSDLKRKLGDTNFRVALKRGMTNAVIFMEGMVKKYTPVGKSGQLRASFTHKVNASGSEGEIGTNKEYAPYVEFGTGVYIGKGRIYPRTKKVLAWDGMVRRSIAGMKGRFFVQRAWDEQGGERLVRFFKESFDEAFK